VEAIALFAAPAAALWLARSVRAVRALVLAGLAMWGAAALLEAGLYGGDDVYLWLLFTFFFLPLVVAPLTGVLASLLLGPPRSLFACGAAACVGCVIGMIVSPFPSAEVSLRLCLRDMAAPADLAASFAVLVGALGQRRV